MKDVTSPLKMNGDEVLVIGLGAQRSGSSWLHRYLSQHPNCFASTVKEIEFFHEKDDAFRNWLIGERCGHIKKIQRDIRLKGWLRQPEPLSPSQKEFLKEKRAEIYDYSANITTLSGYGDYQSNFARRLPNQTHILDFTPSYSLLSAKTLSRIPRFATKTRFLYGMRDPVARAFSAFKYTLSLQSKTIAPRSKVRLKQLKSAVDYEPEILLQSRYDLQLEKFRAAFTPNLLHIYFYEDLFNSVSVNKICNFLELDYREPQFDKRIHSSVGADEEIEMSSIEYEYLREALAPAYDYVERKFSKEMPDAWQKTFAKPQIFSA